MGGALLETVGLSVRFGGVTAVAGVDLVSEPGQICGVIGPNGAGKTTFLDAVSGFVRCGGDVCLGGQSLRRLNPARRAARGLSRSFQGADLFAGLSIGENVALAARSPRWSDAFVDAVGGGRRGSSERADKALDLMGLRDMSSLSPDEVSNGTRKLVGVARALAAGPAVALLDEPAAGLDSEETRVLGERLCAVADSGVTLVLIDHDVDLVMRICQKVYVLNFGQVIAAGTPAEIRQDPSVREAYLGTPAADGPTVSPGSGVGR
jgi:ABC-type branched-subunit amino acid transport system ATPase component